MEAQVSKQHPINQPPALPSAVDSGEFVDLVYADGSIKRGWYNRWYGWLRFDNSADPQRNFAIVADDKVQPVGWRRRV